MNFELMPLRLAVATALCFWSILVLVSVPVECKLEIKRLQLQRRTGDYGPMTWYGGPKGDSSSASAHYFGTSITVTPSSIPKGYTPNKWELHQLKHQQTDIPINVEGVKASLAFLPTILLTPKNPDANKGPNPSQGYGQGVSHRWGTEHSSPASHFIPPSYTRWDKMTPKGSGGYSGRLETPGQNGGGLQKGGGAAGGGWGEAPVEEPVEQGNGWGSSSTKGSFIKAGGFKGGGLKGGGGGGGGWGEEAPPVQTGWGSSGGKGIKAKGRPMKGGGGWGQPQQSISKGWGQGQSQTQATQEQAALGDIGDYDELALAELEAELANGNGNGFGNGNGLNGNGFNKGGGGKGGGRFPKGGNGNGKGGNKGGVDGGWGNGDSGNGGNIGSFWDNPWNLWNVMKFKNKFRRPQNQNQMQFRPGGDGWGPDGALLNGEPPDPERRTFFGTAGSWIGMVLMGLLFIAEVSLTFGDPTLIPLLAIPLAILVLLRMVYEGSGFDMVAVGRSMRSMGLIT